MRTPAYSSMSHISLSSSLAIRYDRIFHKTIHSLSSNMIATDELTFVEFVRLAPTISLVFSTICLLILHRLLKPSLKLPFQRTSSLFRYTQ